MKPLLFPVACQRLLCASIAFACLLSGLSSGNASAVQDDTAATVDFVRDIVPIFQKHCLSCHGPEKEESFRIDDREATMAFIEAGDSAASHLYEVLVSDDEEVLMPPPGENNPLSRSQIRLVRNWIREGADWPEGVSVADAKAAGGQAQSAGAGAASAVIPDPSGKLPDNPAMPEEAGGGAGTSGAATPGAGNQSAAGGSGSATPDPAAGQPQAAQAGQAAKVAGADDEDDLPVPAEKPLGTRIWLALGSLHPAAVHLPIGLLLGAGFFALLGLRGNFVMSDCAYYCLWFGALGAIVATVLGWPSAITGGYGGDPKDLFDSSKSIFLHRLGGIGTTIFALLLALFASAKRASDPDDGLLWKLGAILLAVAIAWVGHLGGKLTHSDRHYDALYKVAEEVTGWEIDGKPNPGQPAGAGDAKPADGNKAAGGDEAASGKTSTEK